MFPVILKPTTGKEQSFLIPNLPATNNLPFMFIRDPKIKTVESTVALMHTAPSVTHLGRTLSDAGASHVGDVSRVLCVLPLIYLVPGTNEEMSLHAAGWFPGAGFYGTVCQHMETVEKILSSNESQMKGTEEAGPELQATPTPPCLTSHFISKWRLTLICCVKPQKKKKEGKKTHPSALQGEVPTLSSPA